MLKEKLEEQISDLLRSLWDISIFYYALLFVLLLLASSIALITFKIPYIYAFIPAGIATVFVYLRQRGADHIRDLERGNTSLRERLRTAYDNRFRDNVIVNDLMRGVIGDLKEVNTDTFLNLRRTTIYVVASIVLVFLLLLLQFTGFGGFDLPFIGDSTKGGLGGGGQSPGGGSGGGGSGGSGEDQSSPENSVGQSQAGEIYSDRSIAQIEGEEMQLELFPEYGGETEIGEEGAQNQEAINEIQNRYVQSTAAQSYSENIPTQLEEIVRKYFEKLTEQ